MGLLTPFTVKSEIILRKLWASLPKLHWDDPVPEQLNENWIKILNEMHQIKYHFVVLLLHQTMSEGHHLCYSQMHLMRHMELQPLYVGRRKKDMNAG